MWTKLATVAGSLLAAGATVPEIVKTVRTRGETVRQTSAAFLIIRLIGFVLLSYASVSAFARSRKAQLGMHAFLFVWMAIFYAHYIVWKGSLATRTDA